MSAANSEAEALRNQVASMTTVVLSLGQRLEALERAQRRSGLTEYNARRAEAAADLHRAIRAIMAASLAPHRLTAKHVLRLLDLNALGCPNLALRTVRHHLRAIRGRG